MENRKRQYYQYEIIHTILEFTRDGIYRSVLEINELIGKQKWLKREKKPLLQMENDASIEPSDILNPEKVKEIYLTFSWPEEIGNGLDRVFDDDYENLTEEDMIDLRCMDIFYLGWNLNTSQNQDIFYLNRGGKPWCELRYNDIIQGQETYDTCPCKQVPEVLSLCQDITQILNKYSIKKKCSQK